jgi:class 3 adenylate cyclase
MARRLPSGTVTFLFTDIEGSTHLLQELGTEGYAEAYATHRRALREAFERNGGVEVESVYRQEYEEKTVDGAGQAFARGLEAGRRLSLAETASSVAGEPELGEGSQELSTAVVRDRDTGQPGA